MAKRMPHIGLRAVKTALAVALALLCGQLLGVSRPIYTIVGAFGVMGRTLDDSLRGGLTQLFGTLIGFAVGVSFASLVPDPSLFIWPGLSVLVAITLCVTFKLEYAIGLSSIVAADLCMGGRGPELFTYALTRLSAAVIGIAVALVINFAIKPYSNRKKLVEMLSDFAEKIPPLARALLVKGEYPRLSELEKSLVELYDELAIYEKQRFIREADHQAQLACLCGCAQLAQRMLQALYALCSIDDRVRLPYRLALRLSAFGISAEELPLGRDKSEAAQVLCYHLRELCDAYAYLGEYLAMAKTAE